MSDTITTKEAMEILDMPRSTFYMRIAQGIITPLPPKPGRVRNKPNFFQREQIERLKNEGLPDAEKRRATAT